MEEHPSDTKPAFPTLEHFYQDNPARRASGEADYGVRWRLANWAGRWRVSYVQDTGEVYAVRHLQTDGPVLLLGHVPPDPQETWRDIYYRTLDRILDRWPEICGGPDSLRWVMEKLDQYTKETNQ